MTGWGMEVPPVAGWGVGMPPVAGWGLVVRVVVAGWGVVASPGSPLLLEETLGKGPAIDLLVAHRTGSDSEGLLAATPPWSAHPFPWQKTTTLSLEPQMSAVRRRREEEEAKEREEEEEEEEGRGGRGGGREGGREGGGGG